MQHRRSFLRCWPVPMRVIRRSGCSVSGRPIPGNKSREVRSPVAPRTSSVDAGRAMIPASVVGTRSRNPSVHPYPGWKVNSARPPLAAGSTYDAGSVCSRSQKADVCPPTVVTTGQSGRQGSNIWLHPNSVETTKRHDMYRAIWNEAVLAESDHTVRVEGNHYFPPASLNNEFFSASASTYHCFWKGSANYYTITVNGKVNRDAAWYYAHTLPAAENIRNHVAFWKGVRVVEVPEPVHSPVSGRHR